MGSVTAYVESEVWQISISRVASRHFRFMGQRHQTFIIAKVGTGSQKRYRCVAAFHWQWLYGQGPARSATRLIRAVKNPTNSILIKADLETFYDYDSEHTEYGTGRWKQFSPCPYISMLYRAATCVGLDDGAYDRCITMDANMRSNGGDNNDGITIFDVTEPQNPRYCMVSVFGLEASEEEYHKSKCYRPMSAKTYVEAYYPYLNPALSESPRQGVTEESIEIKRTAYQGLEGVPLIDAATLSEAFPGEYDPQSTEWTKEPKEDDLSKDKQALNPPPGATPVPSLFSIAARKVVQTSIAEPDESDDSVELLLRSPIDAPTLDILRVELLDQLELPDYVLPLLAKVLIDGADTRGLVDATPFALSPTQVPLLAPMISSCEILKLGGRNNLQIDAVKTMIAALPSLKILVLFDKSFSTEEVESLYLVGPPGLQIGHKLSYFANSRKKPSQIGSRSAELEFAVMLLGKDQGYDGGLLQEAAGYVKLNNPNFVIRALCDMISLLLSNHRYDKRNGLSQVCFGVEDRPYGAPFAPSSLVDLAPEPRFPTTVTRWVFALKAQRLVHPKYPWSYGFVRYNAGVVVDILDLEGFVKALRTEHPELPSVVGFETATGEESSSFYQKLDSILQPVPVPSQGPPFVVQIEPSKLPCKLISPEEVHQVIDVFTGEANYESDF